MFYIVMGVASALILIFALYIKFFVPEAEEMLEQIETTGTSESNEQKITIPVAIITFIIIALPIYFVFSLFTSSDSTDTTTATVEETDRSGVAFIISQNYVSEVLKSPSTADYPLIDFTVKNLGDNRYTVSSYVDSQNSFGATIRSEWHTTLQYEGGDDANPANWKLEGLVFDDKIVYP